MLHKISLDNGFSGEHMGLVFVDGEAHTEDAFLASRLRGKGYTVTTEAGAANETVSDTGEASEAPPPIDEEAFEAALAEAGETVEKFYSEGLSDLDGMNIAQLKAFAEGKGIDLGSAKLKADIIAAITAAMPTADVPEPEAE